MLSSKNNEKEKLYGEIEALKEEKLILQTEFERARRERDRAGNSSRHDEEERSMEELEDVSIRSYNMFVDCRAIYVSSGYQ
jgi:hypothetical protein